MAPNPSFSDRRREACFFVSKLIEGGGVALVTLISVLWEILFKKETLRRDGSSVDNSPKSLADRNKAEVCRDPWTIDPVQIRLHEYQNKMKQGVLELYLRSSIFSSPTEIYSPEQVTDLLDEIFRVSNTTKRTRTRT